MIILILYICKLKGLNPMNRFIKTFLSLIIVALYFHNVHSQTNINFTINQPSVLAANGGTDTETCLGDSIMIGASPTASGGTSPYSYSWEPQTGLSSDTVANPVVSPNATTIYSIIVTDNDNCQDTNSVTITVKSLPVANFGYNAVNLIISFADSSTNALTWFWEFGDGDSSVSQNPTHTYFTEDTYNVCLTVADTFGCKDSTCKLVDAVTTGMKEPLYSATLSVYPNPYTGQTQIAYSLGEKGDVILEVYNLLGKKIETLVNESQPAGVYKYSFSAKSLGHAEGIYTVKLKLNYRIYIRKLIELH